MGAFLSHLAPLIYLFRLEKNQPTWRESAQRPECALISVEWKKQQQQKQQPPTQKQQQKKRYINIHYVDKSVDRSSSSRALCFCLCFSPSLTPNLPQQSLNFSFLFCIHRHRIHLEDGVVEQPRAAPEAQGVEFALVLRPSPLRRREGVC